MKTISIFAILFLLILSFTSIQLFAQITRGAHPNEIYISTEWYIDNFGQIHYAILHSTDNGENIALKYENIENSPPGEMQVNQVLGDATPGALYNHGNNELWLSFDYGENWDLIETYPGSGNFTSGSIEGEIFKNATDVIGNLYFSIDYGYNFISKNTDVNFNIEVGSEIGELYGRSGIAGIGYDLKYSTDYGQSFIEIPIDDTVAFWSIGGYHPQISRGSAPGQLYIVSWWPDYHYKIFHSVNTGYSWIEKFESDYINQYFWEVYYTAGRQPGSFYVMRTTVAPTLNHRLLYIDYSSDYGESFTTYFHDLDSTITGFVNYEVIDIHLSNYPNPFKEYTTFSFKLPANSKNAQLNIYDLHGKLIREIDIIRKKTQIWNLKDNNGRQVKEGIYLYNICYDNNISQFNKLLIIN
jgi:hypothetical protein